MLVKVGYCSKGCQKKGWKSHKNECSTYKIQVSIFYKLCMCASVTFLKFKDKVTKKFFNHKKKILAKFFLTSILLGRQMFFDCSFFLGAKFLQQNFVPANKLINLLNLNALKF